MAISGNLQPLYRSALLMYAMQLKGWDSETTGTKAGLHRDTVNTAMAGQAGSLRTLSKLADTLGVTWKHLFDLDLPESEFRQVIANGKR